MLRWLFLTPLLLSILGTLLVLVSRLSPFPFYLLEANANLAWYYLAVTLVWILLAALGSLVIEVIPRTARSRILLLILAALIIHATILFPFFVFPQLDRKGRALPPLATPIDLHLTVLDRAYGELDLGTLNSDFVALLNQNVGGELPNDSRFPYRIHTAVNEGKEIALLSRYPFRGESITNLGDELPKPIVVAVQPDARHVMTFALFSASAPTSHLQLQATKLLYHRLSTRLRHIETPLLVLGGFNTTVYSLIQERFIDGTETYNALDGLFLSLPITRILTLGSAHDHVLFRGAIEIRKVGDEGAGTTTVSFRLGTRERNEPLL